MAEQNSAEQNRTGQNSAGQNGGGTMATAPQEQTTGQTTGQSLNFAQIFTYRRLIVLISEILGTGRENATTGAALAAFYGISIREVTKEIENERLAGVPICATMGTPAGYFLPATIEDLRLYCKSLERRRDAIERVLQACKRESLLE